MAAVTMTAAEMLVAIGMAMMTTPMTTTKTMTTTMTATVAAVGGSGSDKENIL